MLNQDAMSKPVINRHAGDKANTSGFRGVYFDKQKNRWRARITVAGKKRHLGHFATPEQASAAYQQALAALPPHQQ